MARIRSIKPEFWSSEQVMECSPITRLLFVGLWNFCDDAGNHVNSERTIKAQVFPGDDISTSDVRRMLDELSANGLIAFYVVEGKEYLHVTGWDKHQRIDRPTYKYPPYPCDDSSNARRMLDESSPPDRSGEERKGEEEPPHSPPAEAGGESRRRQRREKTTFQAFIEACHAAGEKPIPADDPIFDFAADARIPKEFLHLAWREFAAKYRDGRKLQADWRKHFRNAVRNNWYRLWWCPGEGTCELTTAGVQLKRELEAERQRQAQEAA